MEVSPLARFLDYGALGLLALVLVGIFIWFTKRDASNQQIIQRLAARALDSESERVTAYQKLAENTGQVNQRLCGAFEAFTVKVGDEHKVFAGKLDVLREGQLQIMKDQVELWGAAGVSKPGGRGNPRSGGRSDG